MSNMESRDGGRDSAVDMGESQRALELRKFFAPFDPCLAVEDASGFNASIVEDGALEAYAETALWRLQGVRTMVSLIDRQTQYFLAGSVRGDDNEVTSDGAWFGCSTVGTSGGLCENTIALDGAADDYPCFQVKDLSEDSRFSSLPVVNGSVQSYRFYAGVPITTENGINIGSLFLFDDKPRPAGLTGDQRKWLNHSASNVMRHLETKREAAERRRVALMSKGIARFLELTSHEIDDDESSRASAVGSIVATPLNVSNIGLDPTSHHADNDSNDDERSEQSNSAKILDKIKVTLDHASKLLRESLELTVGGVVFLDTALGYHETGNTNAYFDVTTDIGAEFEDASKSGSRYDTPFDALSVGSERSSSAGRHARGVASPGQVRAFNAQNRPSKVLAMSAAKIAEWKQGDNVLDGKTLQSLINVYPKGNVWYIDDEGFFSSLEQVNELYAATSINPPGKRKSNCADVDVTRQRAEANLLSKVFVKARQIIFLPLWDAGGKRWYSCCFVWSQSAVPVFTVDSEIAYLSAFTNSVMVEISRLDAISANKMKSNFISSISHEFRSPLHGILASAEFLRETQLDPMQMEFIATIQNCGSTLLDTINHVLDYSKINSFEKKAGENGRISNGLYETSNIALLCEEIVTGMMAAKEFQGTGDTDSPMRPATPKQDSLIDNPPVKIILDFEHRDWNYKIQPGALRRIIMNIFGNAHKYTTTGFILVQLRVRDLSAEGAPSKVMLVMNIMDSGRGMSTQYMERKLYTPFAQEDTFMTGIGLGLSIVWSIVTQLKGKIHIRSEQGKGTDVEVVLPLRPCGQNDKTNETSDAAVSRAAESQACLERLRKLAQGKTAALWQKKSSPVITGADATSSTRMKLGKVTGSEDLAYQCIKKYLHDWFGLEVVDNPELADIILVEKSEYRSAIPLILNASHVLLLRDGVTKPGDKVNLLGKGKLRSVWSPIGPYKLARALETVLKDNPAPNLAHSNETSLPLRSKESPLSSDALINTGSENSYSSTTMPHSVLQSSRPLAEVHSFQPAGNLEHTRSPLHQSEALIPSETSRMPEYTTSIMSQGTDTTNLSQDVSSVVLNILAVDDNTLNLALLQRYLLNKRKCDSIITAMNGVEAVAAVRTSREHFDIIFMDISMPEMDGFEATRLIRSWERSRRHRGSVTRETSSSFDKAVINTSLSNGDDGDSSEEQESVIQKSVNGSIIGIGATNGAKHDAIDDSDGLFLQDGEIRGNNGLGRDEERAYVVALTGLASRRDRDEAEASGFDEFLTKPISFVKIGELLARLAAEKKERT